MKGFLVTAAVIAALIWTSALAGVTNITPGLQNQDPALIKPQLKIKKLPKSSVLPQTGQETENVETESQPATPQNAAEISIQNFEIMPASPSEPPCNLKWVLTFTNTGTAPCSSNLKLQTWYRKPSENPGLAGQVINLTPIGPGETASTTGYVPERFDGQTEVVLKFMDEPSMLLTAVYRLPDAAKPSSSNVALENAAISESQITVTMRNTGNVDVTPLNLIIRGIVNSSGSSEFIGGSIINCIPAGTSQTATVQIPANSYLAYKVQITPYRLPDIVAEREYPKP